MTTKQKQWIVLALTTYLTTLVLLGIFEPNGLSTDPPITPAAFLAERPHVTLFDGWTIIVPSSTIIVYLLGVQILLIGYHLLRNAHRTWGASLLFWGIGTILAGTSYQGLGYELKCDGNTVCLFTDWLELAYLFSTAISIALMGFAFAKQFTTGPTQSRLKKYSEIALIAYTMLLLLGSILEHRFLLSYELFTLFFMPLFLIFFLINLRRFQTQKDDLNRNFVILWILFLFVNLAYYAYYLPGITQTLYENSGIWFSANDVLHVGLIGWFGYFYLYVLPHLHSQEQSALHSINNQ